MNDLTAAPTYTPAATIDAWQAQGERLAHRHRNLMWEVAEWAQFGFEQWGIAAQDIVLATFGRSKAEVAKAMEAHKRFPPHVRQPGLSYSHHATVLPLGDDEARTLLDEAAREGFTVSMLKKRVAAVRESAGGDVFEQMASADTEELHDDWLGQVVRLLNRAPNGDDARLEVAGMITEAKGEFIVL